MLTNQLTGKDDSVLAVVDRLRADLGEQAFVVIDHWPDDRFAIGIASPIDVGVFAHICVFPYPDAADPYFVCLESPHSFVPVDGSYTSGDERAICGLEELVSMLGDHLACTPPKIRVRQAGHA